MRTTTFYGEAVGDVAAQRPPAEPEKECTRCGLLRDEHRFARGVCGGYTRDEAVARARLATDAFGDAVQELVRAVSPFFERPAILGVRVSEDLGAAVGVPPGRTAAIATEIGMVRVDVDPEPRRAELTVAALRHALGAAVREIDEHNSEYNHTTRENLVEHWRKLAAGDPVSETLARLDVAGREARRRPTEAVEAALRAQYARAELRPGPLQQVLDALAGARRHFAYELPRWEDDGGAPAGELCR